MIGMKKGGAPWRWLAWGLGVAAVAFFLSRVGWRTIAATMATVGPRVLWLVAVYLAGVAVMAQPWRLLMAREQRPGVAAAVASRLAASGLNALGPLLAVGELTRLLWVRREHWPEALAAMAVDRLLFLVASALSLAAGALAGVLATNAPRALVIPAAAVAAALVVVAIGLALVAARFTPATAIGRLTAAVGRLIARMRGLPGAPLIPAAERTDAALHALLSGPRRPLLLALAVHVVGRLFVTAEFYAACRVLGLEVGLAQVLVLAAVPLALSLVASVVPSQMGVQEGAQGAVAAALGLGSTAGVLIVLLQRGRQLICLPIAALLLALRTRHPSPHPAPPIESKPGGADGPPSPAGGITGAGGPYGDLGSDRAARSAESAARSRGRA
jgi:hypothetical protein